MKALLRNLTRFVETTLQLYAPLPFEFTADMHTLNAYLRSYSQSEQKLLQSFVNRLAEKLQEKSRALSVKETQTILTNGSETFDNVLKHYNSCTFKYPQLRLNLENQDPNQTCHLQEKPVYSQRSDRTQQAGIKANRHKFGSRHRSKLNGDLSIDKENLSLNFNADHSQDKVLKGIKSELQLTSLQCRKKSADISLRQKKEEGKGKGRYQSIDSRSNNTSSLKIKLKPKPTLDIQRVKQGIDLTLELFSQQNQQIMSLMGYLISSQETPVY